jgi:hypothetical protein
LSPSVGFALGSFGPVAVSGRTVVTDPQIDAQTYSRGVLYVFAQPVGGWSSETEAARLSATDGAQFGAVAISGPSIFAGQRVSGAPGPGSVYVFTRPARGWSGTQHARLAAAGATAHTRLGGSVSASGSTVVATGGGSVYVYVRPSAGWAGTLHQTAKLTTSNGVGLGDVAVSGRTVVATGGRGDLYVFTEPAGGWSGTIHQAARLTASNSNADGAVSYSVAISGPTIVAGASSGAVNVFVEPAKGWHPIIHQRATLTYPAPVYGAGPSVAISGRTAAEVDYDDHYFCPCNGVLHTYIEPPSGWAGKQSATGAVDVNVSAAGNDVAVAGNTVFFGAPDGVHVLQTVGPPNATRLKLSRLASNKPGLRLTLQAGASAPLIKSFAIGLAGGLSYDPRLARVAHGTTIAGGGRYSLSIARGKLLVRLAKPEGRLTIAVAGRALVESGALLTRVRDVLRFNRNRHNRHRQTLTLTVGALLTDAANHTTSTVAQVSIR